MVVFHLLACGSENFLEIGFYSNFGETKKINLVNLEEINKNFEIVSIIHPSKESHIRA